MGTITKASTKASCAFNQLSMMDHKHLLVLALAAAVTFANPTSDPHDVLTEDAVEEFADGTSAAEADLVSSGFSRLKLPKIKVPKVSKSVNCACKCHFRGYRQIHIKIKHGWGKRKCSMMKAHGCHNYPRGCRWKT